MFGNFFDIDFFKFYWTMKIAQSIEMHQALSRKYFVWR
jgi:hypothetical protein